MRRLVVLLTMVSLVVMVQLPAMACSGPLPLSIEQLAGTSDEHADFNIDEVTGVYQLETIAAVPSMGFRNAAAATVVSRYWGEPPGETGVAVTGGDWLYDTVFTDCEPDPMPPAGESAYGFGVNGDPSRFVSVQLTPGAPYAEGTIHGDLTTDQVAALDKAYGPHTTIPISVGNRVHGVATVWYPNLLIVGALAGIISLAIRRIRKRATTNHDSHTSST